MIAALIFPIGAGCVILTCELMVITSSHGKIFSSVDTTPHCPVGLVLGCGQYLANGRENLYFRYRIDAAEQLYKAGKVDVLIVSGDNHRKGYDEPSDMKNALIKRGIPAEKVHCDYAGFRTLDSVIRARDVFCCNRMTVISQRFHGQRAVFIGNARDIDTLGFAARDVSSRAGLKTKLRERLARVKAVMDVTILRKQPKFRGEKIPVLTASRPIDTTKT
ncbi:MAG: ElyC/SanA/YdcF family protein [Lentisphaeria bacterium]|nr:ElyC/SanA/YdcF family protein [Lentisphaeria bacterium]